MKSKKADKGRYGDDPIADHEPGTVGRHGPGIKPGEAHGGDDVQSETEEITRYTYSAGHWYVRATSVQLAKYAAMNAEDKTQFLGRKMRVRPGYSHHTAESLASTLAHDLKAIQRKLGGGDLKGSRGKPLD